ncbi:hypothetical protein QQ045_025285 [Rhodiola kirilowii]
MDMNSGQHVPHRMTAPIQHLVPGPPPAMSGVSPFHQVTDMSGSAKWSHVAHPHQLRPDCLMPVAPSPTLINMVPDSRTNTGVYPATSSALASQPQAGLGSVQPSSSAPYDPSNLKNCLQKR